MKRHRLPSMSFSQAEVGKWEKKGVKTLKSLDA